MLESILYIALGALLAILIVLLIAPAIWRRAEILTRQRMEAAVPLTLSELQAEKDQLRAGHALRVRKLEEETKRLSGKLADAAIKAAKDRDGLLELEAERTRHAARILELETRCATLEDELEQTGKRLADATHELDGARAELAQRETDFNALNARHIEMTDDFDSQKIEIAAREARLEAGQQEGRTLRDELKRKTEEIDRLNAALKQTHRDLDNQTGKLAAARAKNDTLQTSLADSEGRLERRDADLARLRAAKGDGGTLLHDAEREIDRLTSALAAEQAAPGNASDKPQDMAALRATLTDLAARMTAQVAAEEGPESKVDQALAEMAAFQSGSDTGASGGTLADRIRSHRAEAPAARPKTHESAQD